MKLWLTYHYTNYPQQRDEHNIEGNEQAEESANNGHPSLVHVAGYEVFTQQINHMGLWSWHCSWAITKEDVLSYWWCFSEPKTGWTELWCLHPEPPGIPEEPNEWWDNGGGGGAAVAKLAGMNCCWYWWYCWLYIEWIADRISSSSVMLLFGQGSMGGAVRRRFSRWC